MKFSPNRRASLIAGAIAVALSVVSGPASAQKKYGPGVTDTEIKLGQTMPYSGPASAYGTIGKAEAAYFKKVNDEGGINGRSISAAHTIWSRSRQSPAGCSTTPNRT